MKTWLVIILLAITSTTVYSADEIKPFISDGCSSFPDGTLEDKDLWLSCCTAHDFAYWVGGTYQDRVEADESLRLCVTNVGEPVIAKLMLAGVRVGGTPYLPTKFRWGYGWPYPRGYKVINEQENKKVQAQLKLLGNDR
ncbi:hypothetical protein CMT41_11405 [Colwellia sp. MT41]|uniref:hypothetical protein n=1 Tax=Colwellia sp. MT41 TaxID=58049 RepID=UPI000717922B|nr:hypothetical protein [Colwellia sp. MT41]ALO35259.1 hypothetical protein CMT41_11405 [Colwellia sp. MT41]